MQTITRINDEDDVVNVAHRRATIWFLGIITVVILTCVGLIEWHIPVDLTVLSALFADLVLARIVLYFICRSAPSRIGLALTVCSITFVLPLIVAYVTL